MVLEIVMVILAYLLGSISSAILVCRIAGLPDPRTQGSKNPGATNVLRMSNSFTAAIVLIFDILKGTIPVWGAYFLGLTPITLGFIALAACLGHIFPVFFGFKGGKAVATAFGVVLPINGYLALTLILIWVIIAKISRYSSLAAIITVSCAPILTWIVKPIYVIPVLMISVLIILRHHENIYRLVKGNERKIFEKNDNQSN